MHTCSDTLVLAFICPMLPHVQCDACGACVALQIPGHVASDQYGKYGIIRESDLASKISEFQQWATEVKRVNIEALAKWEEKELFAEFMEDYNTSTLPHRKYYDLMAYAQQQAIKAAKKGKAAGVRAHLNTVASGSAWTSVNSASPQTSGQGAKLAAQNL